MYLYIKKYVNHGGSGVCDCALAIILTTYSVTVITHFLICDRLFRFSNPIF